MGMNLDERRRMVRDRMRQYRTDPRYVLFERLRYGVRLLQKQGYHVVNADGVEIGAEEFRYR